MDMTPMIDIVFQLIIFFVVTLKMTKDFNKDIKLEEGKFGQTITGKETTANTQMLPLEIELARNGRISIANYPMTEESLRMILRNRVNRMGNKFPILIRADKRASHEQVKRVMDICTEADVWELSFVAIQEKKAKD
jgi:biopolymer transport protein ExbD